VNSEDEEEFDDDIVSQSGSESVSVQGSELDLDSMDDVDSLVLNIRDKLRMANNVPQYRTSHSAGDYCWTESPSAASTPNSIHSTASNTDNDLLILPPHQRSSAATPSTSGSGGGSSKGGRKRRNSASRSWRHHHSHSSNNPTQSYYKQFHHQSGSISKSKYQNHWWSSRPFSDLSKQSRSKDAYHLLQELLSSGTLIKEAVRRLNRKCLNSSSSLGSSSSSGNYNNNITSVATVSSNPSCYGSSSSTSNNNSIPLMMDSSSSNPPAIRSSSNGGVSNNLPSFTHYNYN